MTLHEYTLALLKDTGCAKNAYCGSTVEQALKDITEYEKEHGQCPFPAKDIAEELVRIGNNGRLEPLPPPPVIVGFASNGDACKWGLTDLYERDEQLLRKAIESGERFDTGWVGCAKEIRSMRICRDEDIIVECCAEMDSALEQEDLFADFLTDEELEMLDAGEVADIEQIRGMLMWGDFVEEVTESDHIPTNATYKEVMSKVAELEQVCENRLEESFHECISTTLYCLYPNMDEKELTDLINKRIEGV